MVPCLYCLGSYSYCCLFKLGLRVVQSVIVIYSPRTTCSHAFAVHHTKVDWCALCRSDCSWYRHFYPQQEMMMCSTKLEFPTRKDGVHHYIMAAFQSYSRSKLFAIPKFSRFQINSLWNNKMSLEDRPLLVVLFKNVVTTNNRTNNRLWMVLVFDRTMWLPPIIVCIVKVRESTCRVYPFIPVCGQRALRII